MRKLKLAGAALATALSLPAAAQFSSTIFFGDSLTDSGTFAPLLPPGTGKFTTNPGPVWSEDFAAALGTGAVPATQGGTNYAVGGARVTGSPGIPPAPPTATATPVATQVNTYLASTGGRADPGAIYSIWAGANDIFFIAPTAASNPAAASAYLTQTAGELIGAIARLKAAGARNVIVFSLPNIGATPFGVAQGAAGSAGLAQLSQGYNQLLFGGLSLAGIQVIPVDISGLLAAVQANPAGFGFINATSPACGATASLLCTSANLVAPNAAQTFVFADGVHPTTAGHAVVAGFVEGLIAAPGQISLLAESPVKTRAALNRLLFERGAGAGWARPQGETTVWVTLDAADLRFERGAGLAGAKGYPLGLTVGAEKFVAPNVLIGGAGSAGRYDADFTGPGGGGYTQNELALSLYGAWLAGPFRLAMVGTLGDLDYDVDRGVRLGSVTKTMSGSTDGSSVSLAFQASYEFAAGALSHGPFAGIDFQRIRVKGFSESGEVPGLAYGQQTRLSTLASLGYRASYDFGMWRPYAQASWERELRDNDRQVFASVPTLLAPGFELPAVKPDRNYGMVAAGAAAKLAPGLTGSLTAYAQFGQHDVRDYGLQLSVAKGF